ERLVAAQGDRLLDLLIDDLARQDVGVVVRGLAVEGAEVTDRGADVGVIDVAVDVVSAVGLGVEPAADGVGGPAQSSEVAAVEQGEALFGSQSSSVNGFPQDIVHVHGNLPPLAALHYCARPQAAAGSYSRTSSPGGARPTSQASS